MLRKRDAFIIITTATIAGVLGGAIWTRLLLPDPVSAQTPKAIKAHRFVVVDQRGRERANLGLVRGSVGLSLWGLKRSGSLSLTVYDQGKPHIVFQHQRRVIAKLPADLPAKFRRSRSVPAVDKITLPTRSTGREGGGIMREKSVSPAALDVIEEKMNELVESVNDLRAFH